MKSFFIAVLGGAFGAIIGCSVHQASMAKATGLQDFGVCEVTSIGTERGEVQVLDCNEY